MAPVAADTYREQAAQTASGPQLLVMLYERMATDLALALDALENRGDLYITSEALVHAQQIIRVLRAALDPSGFSGADQLAALYDFLERETIQANLAKDPQKIRDCIRVLEPLRRAWADAVEQVERGLA